MESIHGSLQTARQNIDTYEDARLILNRTKTRISPWLKIRDRHLPNMIPPPEVPRAFNSSFDGCPVHGVEYFRFGNYSWILDPFKRPWKITCPVGGEEYPSNNFQSFLDSGMSDRSLLTGDYPDDGWGWKREGEFKKHWFVAYYCHWYWYNYVIPAVLGLSRVYLLTGKEAYGRKCLILLHKIAEYYPRMNYNAQSRYAQEFRPDYDGKIVNRIWETNVIRSLAEAVSNTRGYLNKGTAGLVGKGLEELGEFLEERILLEGLRGIGEEKIVGNYGMHQDAMLVILKALGREEETTKGLDFLLNNPGGGYYHQGIRYALDNFIYREGISYENAPGYCFTWSRKMLSIAVHLRSMGIEFPDMQKLRRMLEAADRIVCLRKFTPAVGDSGSVTSGRVEISGYDAARAYRMFPSPLFAKWTKPGFSSYEDLFLPPVTDQELKQYRRPPPRKRSGCLGGYGLVILRARGLECSMFFGRKNGHGHHDRLGIELFGGGQRITPDLGYPQFASESKNPPAWERNTISHNTVTVNERKQDSGSAGSLRMFHSGKIVQVAEASANRTYDPADVYARTIALIGDGTSFFVDIFRVMGGFAHDYSIHGLDREFVASGIGLKKSGGTLAGPDIPYGYLYDDTDLEKPDKERSFYSYRGSGFSYLYDLEVGTPAGPWWAEWRSPRNSLRMFFPHQCNEAVIASGNPPIKPENPESLRYVILRNRGSDLKSTFTAVGECYREKGSVSSAWPVEVGCDKASAFPVAIMVDQGMKRHLILSSMDPGVRLRAMDIEFEGRFLLLTLDRKGSMIQLFMEGRLYRQGDLEVNLCQALSGRIIRVDPQDDKILVREEDSGSLQGIVGETAFIQNDTRSSSFRVVVAEATKEGVILGLEHNGRIGRLLAQRAGECEVKTQTKLIFAEHGYLEGARLVDADYRRWLAIDRVEGDTIHLAEPLGEFSLPHAYIWEFGPGDCVTVGPKIRLESSENRWRGWSNTRAKVTQGVDGRKLSPGRFTFSRNR